MIAIGPLRALPRGKNLAMPSLPLTGEFIRSLTDRCNRRRTEPASGGACAFAPWRLILVHLGPFRAASRGVRQFPPGSLTPNSVSAEHDRRQSALSGIDEILNGHPLASFSAAHLELLGLMFAYWREAEVEGAIRWPRTARRAFILGRRIPRARRSRSKGDGSGQSLSRGSRPRAGVHIAGACRRRRGCDQAIRR